MAGPAINLQNVTKNFGANHVLRGVGLDIPAGGSVVVIGPSGTGKTVLLKTLIGVYAPDGGSLTLIASELAHLGRAKFAAYCASKAGVIGLTRALAHEFAPRVRVNAVAPGPTDTPMLSAEVMSPVALALETQNPMGRIGTPQEIAAAVVFLASPGASFMTGQTICPSGGAVML